MTTPTPLPLAPAVIVIHADVLVAVQAQPEPAVTLTDPVPPVAGDDPDGDPSVKVQGVPACVTVNVWPPAVMVPVRSVVLGFGATS